MATLQWALCTTSSQHALPHCGQYHFSIPVYSVHTTAAPHSCAAALNLAFLISRGLQGPLHYLCFSCKNTNTQTHTHTDIRPSNHIAIHTSSLAHAEMSAVFLPQVPSHIRPTLIIKGRGVRVVPLSVQLRAGDPLIHSSGFVWASGLTHLPTPQASAGPRSEGRLLFSSNNCS